MSHERRILTIDSILKKIKCFGRWNNRQLTITIFNNIRRVFQPGYNLSSFVGI